MPLDATLLRSIADECGTPLYVYDAASIEARWNMLQTQLTHPRRSVYYSMKANSAVGIVMLLVSLGAKLDACSPGDLAVARRAGANMREVSYLGVGCSDSDLDAVVEAGAFFIADSIDQIQRYGQREDARSDIGIRVNCNVADGFHGHSLAGAWDTKFGVHLPDLPAALDVAARNGFEVVGLHTHLGSEVLRPDAYLQTLQVLLEQGGQLPYLRFVNVGGGWGTPFLPGDEEFPLAEFNEAANELLAKYEVLYSKPIELRLEPGGYLVMESGVLLTTVTEIKGSFVYVDSSTNHLISAAIYNTQHPVTVAGDTKAERAVVSVVGGLHEVPDVLAGDRELPLLDVGDVLIVGKAGGYTASRATAFNGQPRPAEVLVRDGVAMLIRRAETVEDLMSRDV